MRKKISSLIASMLLVSIMFSALIADAGRKSRVKKVKRPVETSLIVDGKTGKILHSRNARTKIYLASLTKVMTIYLMFESLKSGKLTLNKKLYVSKYATQALPGKLYLKHKDRISVRDAILALTVKSANDVARVVQKIWRVQRKNLLD